MILPLRVIAVAFELILLSSPLLLASCASRAANTAVLLGPIPATNPGAILRISRPMIQGVIGGDAPLVFPELASAIWLTSAKGDSTYTRLVSIDGQKVTVLLPSGVDPMQVHRYVVPPGRHRFGFIHSSCGDATERGTVALAGGALRARASFRVKYRQRLTEPVFVECDVAPASQYEVTTNINCGKCLICIGDEGAPASRAAHACVYAKDLVWVDL